MWTESQVTTLSSVAGADQALGGARLATATPEHLHRGPRASEDGSENAKGKFKVFGIIV